MCMYLYMSLACDDGSIKVWDIPKDGMKESLTEPSFSLTGKLIILMIHAVNKLISVYLLL